MMQKEKERQKREGERENRQAKEVALNTLSLIMRPQCSLLFLLKSAERDE